MQIGHTVPILRQSFIGLAKVMILMNRLKSLKLSKMIFHFGKHSAGVLPMQSIPTYSVANRVNEGFSRPGHAVMVVTWYREEYKGGFDGDL